MKLVLSLISLVAGALVPSASHELSIPSAASLDSGFAAVIQADVASSTYDSHIGKELWVTGDVTHVDGTSVVGYYGYPHGAFVTSSPGSASFTVLPGAYGTDYWDGSPNPAHYYQQVPNWSDGTYFWASFPVISGNTLNVIGERVQGVSTFNVLGAYDAQFNATTLAYEGIIAVPGTSGDAWSGIAQVSGGWWLTSQQGDVAFVPSDDIGVPAEWVLYPGSVPVTAGSWPVEENGQYQLFCAVYGGADAEEYASSSMTGSWAGPSDILMLPQPQTDGGIIVHQDLPAPSGEILISWDVNSSTTYDPEFAYVRS